MKQVDVAIIGAGTAGTLAAAMLGRAGYSTYLIDPALRFAPEFRCEKLESGHVEVLQKAGLLDKIVPLAKRYDEIWIARLGRLVEKRARTEYGIDYSTLVNRLRDLVPGEVEVIADKAVGLRLDPQLSQIDLANGRTLSARLVVMATGLNNGLFEKAGIERDVISRCHSVSAGFNVAPEGNRRFAFEALTYFGERPEHRVAYFTLFPMGEAMRANLFVYRDKGDPWFNAFRTDPVKELHAIMPRLKRLTGDFRVLDTPRLRPMDLVQARSPVQPGLVLIGDAFATVCPVSGTGAIKAMFDAERLCSTYIPKWLRSPEIGPEQVVAFYNDPDKRRSDQRCRDISLSARRLALGAGPWWQMYRWLRFAGSRGRGAIDQLKQQISHLDHRTTDASPLLHR